MVFDKLVLCLERRAWLRIPIWHFGYRSLFQPYGRLFLRHVVLASPCGFASALRRAREIWGRGPKEGIWRTFPGARAFDLVAIGFCMKPRCPAGRFTHRCLYAEGHGLQELPPQCSDCPVAGLVRLAASAYGASFYIMTSALDVAHDLLVPNLRKSLWRTGLFFLCPYSSRPFLLAALASGFEAEVVTFCSGACSSYEEFLLADAGKKDSQTQISAADWSTYCSPAFDEACPALERRGNVYWPRREAKDADSMRLSP